MLIAMAAYAFPTVTAALRTRLAVSSVVNKVRYVCSIAVSSQAILVYLPRTVLMVLTANQR